MNVERMESSFTFRTNSETGYKRPTVSVSYDVLTAIGAIAILQTPDTKEAKLIIDNFQSLVTSYIRGLVDNDDKFDQATLELLAADGKLTLEAIANLPKSERNVLSKEDLEEFAKSYISVMPEITGKTLAKVQAAAGLFVERFKRVAGDNEVLSVLQTQLATFVEKAPTELLAKHEKAVTFLGNKLEELLSVKVTADAL